MCGLAPNVPNGWQTQSKADFTTPLLYSPFEQYRHSINEKRIQFPNPLDKSHQSQLHAISERFQLPKPPSSSPVDYGAYLTQTVSKALNLKAARRQQSSTEEAVVTQYLHCE